MGGSVHALTVWIGTLCPPVPGTTGSRAFFTTFDDICHGAIGPGPGIMQEMSILEPESVPRSPSGGEDGEGVAGFRRLVWWSSVGLAYAVGVFVVVAILVSEPWGPLTALGAGGVAVSAWASARLLDRRLGAFPVLNPGSFFDAPTALVVISAAGALAAVVMAASVPDLPTWAIIPGVAAGAIALGVPRARRMWTVAAAVALATVVAVSVHYGTTGEVNGSQQVTNAVLMGVIALAFISTMWSWDVVVRLDRTRLLEAELAVADERLRFAADLHDVQGHHLHVIALESELATRLAESDPEAAREHMEQVHQHARTALEETRDLVQGYRRTSLGAELANATRVLSAAGIDGRLGHGTEAVADRVPEGGRHLLGLVVREATTNVLRHSSAASARLELEVDGRWVRLQVANDGAAAPDQEPGTGLATLSDRLDAVGGKLAWGRDGEWFRVDARIPVGEWAA